MISDRQSIETYLNRELRYWKSLKIVYVNKGEGNKILKAVQPRFKDEDILSHAEKRFKNMATVVGLFKPEYLKQITERVNKELGANFSNALDINEIKRWQAPGHPGASLMWLEWVVIVIIVIIVIVAEANDNNGAGEDDTVIVTVGTQALASLVEEDAYLECDEIETLNYSSWATYLLMVQIRKNTGEYMKALICANCASLRTLVESFNYQHESYLPDEVSWLAYFLYAAKLDECEIAY